MAHRDVSAVCLVRKESQEVELFDLRFDLMAAVADSVECANDRTHARCNNAVGADLSFLQRADSADVGKPSGAPSAQDKNDFGVR